nr:hypothetical protein [Candidatus Cloacimonadota bacterium]
MSKLLVIVMFFTAVTLSAQPRRDFVKLKEYYDSGNITEAKKSLNKLKPNQDEERAMLLYYRALLQSSSREALSDFNTAIDMYPQTHYGQLSMLEAAKIYILDREITTAQTLLRRINSAEIVQRFYWLAVTHFWLEDYSAAIANAENYLRLKNPAPLSESALHLIADSYIAQKKYQSALASLQKISRLDDVDLQYLKYKEGYTYELMGNSTEALKKYKEGYEINKYSQIAFDIEEKLFALKSKVPSLDLSFLYPYEKLQLDPKTTTIAESSCNTVSDTVFVAENHLFPTIDANLPIKLLFKPTQGHYLQAGRFSVETNAERLVHSIREMMIPASYYEDNSQGNTTWVVLAGPFAKAEEMNIARRILSDNDINNFVVQY